MTGMIARRGPERLVYSMGRTSMFLPEEIRETTKRLVEDGLAPTEGAALRTILEAATTLKKEDIVGSFHTRALELMNGQPGLSYREACAELGRRGGAKARAEAERARKADEKAKKYQAEMRKRSGEREDA